MAVGHLAKIRRTNEKKNVVGDVTGDPLVGHPLSGWNVADFDSKPRLSTGPLLFVRAFFLSVRRSKTQ